MFNTVKLGKLHLLFLVSHFSMHHDSLAVIIIGAFGFLIKVQDKFATIRQKGGPGGLKINFSQCNACRRGMQQ